MKQKRDGRDCILQKKKSNRKPINILSKSKQNKGIMIHEKPLLTIMIHAHPPKAEISYWFYSQNSVGLKITEEKQGKPY